MVEEISEISFPFKIGNFTVTINRLKKEFNFNLICLTYFLDLLKIRK